MSEFTTDGMAIGEQRQAGDGRLACMIEKTGERSYRTARYLDPAVQADFEHFKATAKRVVTDKFSPAASDIAASQSSDTDEARRQPMPTTAQVQR